MNKHNSESTALNPELTIGVDLGDRYSHFCVLDASGEVVEDGRVTTTPVGLSRRFGSYSSARVALEVTIGSGPGRADLLTTDLSYEYIRINAEYTT